MSTIDEDMRRFQSRGLYHLALIITCVTAFNWAFIQLTGVNVVIRVFSGITIPPQIIAIAVCISAIIVLWRNWVD